MEHSEEFQALLGLIARLEMQLTFMEESQLQNDYVATRRSLEEHFERCIHALEARQQTLLNQLDLLVLEQKKASEEAQTNVKEVLRNFNELLKTGSSIYKTSSSAAERIWKESQSIPLPASDNSRSTIQATLPIELLLAIDSHGSVGARKTASSHVTRAPLPYTLHIEKVTTVAGSTQGLKNGSGDTAKFGYPKGICYHANNNSLYVCDSANSSIRQVSTQGDVETLVQTVVEPVGIASYQKGNCLYITDRATSTINKLYVTTGDIDIFAGNGKVGRSDRNGTGACFNRPSGIAVEQKTGNVYVADTGNHTIRKISPAGDVSTIAGSSEFGYYDGIGVASKFNGPTGLCFDESDQSLIVCDTENHKVRRITPEGVVSTLCSIHHPQFVAIGSNKAIIVSSSPHKIYSVLPDESGKYKAVCITGSEKGGKLDGTAEESRFFYPMGIVIQEHLCFVADCGNNAIRKITFNRVP